MKKIAMTLSIVLISALFSGCGAEENGNPSVSFNGSADTSYKDGINDTSGRQYALNVESDDIVVLKHEYMGISEDRTDYLEISDELLGYLNTVDLMSGCAIRSNKDIQRELDGKTYNKLVSRDFTTTGDINSFMHMYLTDNIISDRYADVVGGSEPCMADIDGALYVLDDAEKCGFSWIVSDDKADVTVTNSDDDSFAVSASYDDNGSVFYLNILFIKDEGYWKVNSIEMPEYEEELSW